MRFFTSFAESFYSAAPYRRARQGKGWGFCYLLALAAFAALALVPVAQHAVDRLPESREAMATLAGAAPAAFQAALRLLTVWLILLAYLLFVQLLLLLVTGIGGWVMAKLLRDPLPLTAIMRIAAVGFTPVITLFVVILLLGYTPLHPAWLLSLGMLMLAAGLPASRESA